MEMKFGLMPFLIYNFLDMSTLPYLLIPKSSQIYVGINHYKNLYLF